MSINIENPDSIWTPMETYFLKVILSAETQILTKESQRKTEEIVGFFLNEKKNPPKN